MQQYTYIYLLLNYSTCFGRPSRPSSGVNKTVVAASGADHTIWGASFLKRPSLVAFQKASSPESAICRARLRHDGTRAETRFSLSAQQTSPFKLAGEGGGSVQSTAGSRGVRISGSNAGYTMFRGSVKGTGYPLHLNQ